MATTERYLGLSSLYGGPLGPGGLREHPLDPFVTRLDYWAASRGAAFFLVRRLRQPLPQRFGRPLEEHDHILVGQAAVATRSAPDHPPFYKVREIPSRFDPRQRPERITGAYAARHVGRLVSAPDRRRSTAPLGALI